MNLDNVNFVSNDNLRTALEEQTDATPAQIDAAVEVNEDTRLRTLRFGLLFLAAVSATAIIPAGRLPNYRREEIPAPGDDEGAA
ncbi:MULTISPECIES: hypothetical protein [Gordonia]|uniref:Uncharacterized protein n=1 Tax=Gordonia cholesterolivorans TaxID=559625 RepID=A0ABP5UK03_9ACTN|nr:hypothetical protein [Gordonia sihwensis]